MLKSKHQCSRDVELEEYGLVKFPLPERESPPRKFLGRGSLNSGVFKWIEFKKDVVTDEDARAKRLILCSQASEHEKHTLNALVALIPYLCDCHIKPMSEAHLSASYIHPFIHGLLGSRQPTRIAHCSNLVPDEQDVGHTNRPDYKVDVYESYEYAYTTTYGEVKSSKNISPTLLVEDFYRIAIFCKDALDKFGLEATLGFQAVNTTITFFVMSLKFHKLYTFTELASFDIPKKKGELLNMLGHLDDLLLISLIHKSLCVKAENNMSDYHCATAPYIPDKHEPRASKKRKLSLTIGR